ncbi:MAG: aminopeptidase P family protein [Myxococcaceae bacterium]|nr:aminopeptidase P family protein [Myxococcaceae bacterium]
MSFVTRREAFLSKLDRPALLFAGGALPRNYPANLSPYRADSNFLYFFDRPEPGSAALFDPDDRSVTLYLPERTLDDALWHGELPSFEKVRESSQVTRVEALERIKEDVAARLRGRPLDSLAVSDPRATARARKMTGADLAFDDDGRVTRPELADTLFALRIRKGDDELAQMRETAKVTLLAHLEAMRASKPGVRERTLAGLVEGAFARAGMCPAYGTILSVRGEVLHNHGHDNVLQAGDLVLLDAGAEAPSGYCSDVTRTWPVGGPFSPEARDLYELVLEAQLKCIAMVRPGVRYRDIHTKAALVMTEGLVALGLLRGDPASLVEQGAHAVFFPHGVGHMIGLDVHDLEAFGDRLHYPGRQRSPQFGTKYLRMDRDLEVGHVVTIEPGLYFIPAILRSRDLRAQFQQQVDFERAEQYLAFNGGRGFGGIRIEDDVVCGAERPEVLTAAIPKDRAAVEAIAGTAG